MIFITLAFVNFEIYLCVECVAVVRGNHDEK